MALIFHQSINTVGLLSVFGIKRRKLLVSYRKRKNKIEMKLISLTMTRVFDFAKRMKVVFEIQFGSKCRSGLSFSYISYVTYVSMVHHD